MTDTQTTLLDDIYKMRGELLNMPELSPHFVDGYLKALSEVEDVVRKLPPESRSLPAKRPMVTTPSTSCIIIGQCCFPSSLRCFRLEHGSPRNIMTAPCFTACSSLASKRPPDRQHTIMTLIRTGTCSTVRSWTTRPNGMVTPLRTQSRESASWSLPLRLIGTSPSA